MPSHPDLLLTLWRELGQGADLDRAAQRMAAHLGQALPLRALELLACDARTRTFSSVAAAGCAPCTAWQVGAPALRELTLRLARAPVLHAGDGATWPAALAPLAREAATGTLLAGLLGAGGGPLAGIAVLRGGPGGFGARHRQILAALLEPLTTLVIREAGARNRERDRAAADAERQALLARLGREEIADTIVGAETGLATVMQRVAQVAPSASSVLLLGETGSGKEVVARAIHERSRRRQRPFVRVNCGALAPELVDSELFGHEKGSFTGAVAQRRGWFERADGGTLFLDEVGELPLPVQVRLLRVLHDGSMQRVGAEQTLHVDVRIVAATHRDLQGMVADGRFREDLWYRLAVFPVRIPPLRERQDDIPALAQHFARRAAAKLGLPLRLPAPADLALLRAYPWPGNVREMATVIERAALLGTGTRLDCAAALGMAPPPSGTGPAPVPATTGFATLDQAMAAHIRAALERTQGRIEGPRGAARLLAINPHTLRARMRKLGVVPAAFREGTGADGA